tara:strand:- start:60 stop:758 length:699 start_codon:yes stop_codon:yes gene_type:complete
MTFRHPPSWNHFFESAKAEIDHACRHMDLCSTKSGRAVFPTASNVINAFWATPLPMLKVVIIGQDPYPGQLSSGMPKATGMSFSTVRQKGEIPASLKTIYKELERTVEDWKMPNHGDLTCWARQGVLMLNAALTVECGKPGLHTGFWKPFTEKLMDYINENCKDVVFLLWGRNAQKAASSIYTSKHHKLETFHPSPNNEGKTGREFATCDHFNLCNEILLSKGIRCIDWRIK